MLSDSDKSYHSDSEPLYANVEQLRKSQRRRTEPSATPQLTQFTPGTSGLHQPRQPPPPQATPSSPDQGEQARRRLEDNFDVLSEEYVAFTAPIPGFSSSSGNSAENQAGGDFPQEDKDKTSDEGSSDSYGSAQSALSGKTEPNSHSNSSSSKGSNSSSLGSWSQADSTPPSEGEHSTLQIGRAHV